MGLNDPRFPTMTCVLVGCTGISRDSTGMNIMNALFGSVIMRKPFFEGWQPYP